MFDTRIIADRKIQEAMEEGAFDNLPGKGKPLSLEDDAHIPPHLRIANRILKNADIAPEWIQLDGEIRKERSQIAATWDRIAVDYPRRKSRAAAGDDRAMQHFAEWHAHTRGSYVRAIKQLNSDILTYNCLAPATASVHVPLKLNEETTRFDEAFAAPAGAQPEPKPCPEEPESKVRAAAAELYRARLRR